MICTEPYLYVEGVSSVDVRQGDLGNCWFVAACSCLTLHKDSWLMVMPDYKAQEWNMQHPLEYVGIFRFRFCQFGEWVEVVIDDRLPSINNRLLYCHSAHKNEFWSALLEKAYAKLKGSYEILDGGELAESLMDFTGGVVENLRLNQPPLCDSEEAQDELFRDLLLEDANRSLMCTAIPADEPEDMERVLPNGLVMGHAYSITGVRIFNKNTDTVGSSSSAGAMPSEIRLLRLRNPWGCSGWNGRYSAMSEEYQALVDMGGENLSSLSSDKAEFWMLFEDYLQNFLTLAVCRVFSRSIASLTQLSLETKFNGIWTNSNSGGCLNFSDTFLRNPQYLIQVDGHESVQVSILLTQKMPRCKDDPLATGLMHIGFTLLQVENNRDFRVQNAEHANIVKSSPYKNSRSIFCRVKLEQGAYVVLPSSFEPKMKQTYILRIFTSRPCKIKELKSKPQSHSFLPQLTKVGQDSHLCTRLSIIQAENLKRAHQCGAGANPYCVVTCEGECFSTSVKRDTLSPVWDESFLLIRANPHKRPIKIEVFSKNEVFDNFLGYVTVSATEQTNGMSTEQCSQEVTLTDREGQSMPGSLIISVENYDNKSFMSM